MIVANKGDKTLEIPDLGVTIRSLLAAADSVKGAKDRQWRISYKGAIIGTVRLRDREKSAKGN